MSNLEIAKLFNEEDSFKQTVLNALAESDGNVSMSYKIYVEEYIPLTEKQQEAYDEYGFGGEIQLSVDINIEELLG